MKISNKKDRMVLVLKFYRIIAASYCINKVFHQFFCIQHHAREINARGVPDLNYFHADFFALRKAHN